MDNLAVLSLVGLPFLCSSPFAAAVVRKKRKVPHDTPEQDHLKGNIQGSSAVTELVVEVTHHPHGCVTKTKVGDLVEMHYTVGTQPTTSFALVIFNSPPSTDGSQIKEE
mmetsp:Transcript_3222/g.9154  ORF Transcript_3222/g.9154 Transcript_3222/m.9154 type:complete len:109 (-) Transcript_3222:630-956(-)